MKASLPNEFNDTFEFCPASDPDSLIRKVSSDPTLVQYFYEQEVWRGYKGTFQQFKATELPTKLYAGLRSVDLESKDLNARDEGSKYVGVVCLSRSSLVHLLWSHYADCHRGCALGIDVSHKCFERARFNGRAFYASERPIYRWDVEGAAHHAQMLNLVKTKSINWKYEREYRMAFPVEELHLHEGMHFVSLHPQALRRVVYGEFITSESKRQIEAALRSSDCAHVRRFQIRRHPQKYTLSQYRLNQLDSSRPHPLHPRTR